MNIKEAADEILNKESKVNQNEEEFIAIAQKICDLKKATNELEIGNITLEKKLNDAKMERAKLTAEVNLFDELITATKNKVNNTILNVNEEKCKLDESQSEVWSDLEKFVENTQPLNDEKFHQTTTNYDMELREMEKEILKLASEVEVMQDITKMQELKIEEIKKMNRDDTSGNSSTST